MFDFLKASARTRRRIAHLQRKLTTAGAVNRKLRLENEVLAAVAAKTPAWFHAGTTVAANVARTIGPEAKR